MQFLWLSISVFTGYIIPHFLTSFISIFHYFCYYQSLPCTKEEIAKQFLRLFYSFKKEVPTNLFLLGILVIIIFPSVEIYI